MRGAGAALAAALLIAVPWCPGGAGWARAASGDGELSALVAAVGEVGARLNRSVAPDAAGLRAALRGLEEAERGVAQLRERREAEAGEDEDALEVLYGSREWLRLEHLSGEIHYWRGWAQLRRAEAEERAGAGAGSAAARGEFRAARKSFARSLRQLRDPEIAREILLAIAIAERGAGDAVASTATAARIARLFPGAPPEFQRRLELERARTARARGDLDEVLARSRDADTAAPHGLALSLLRFEALLEAPASEGGGERSEVLAATARALLAVGGDAAARTVSRLAALEWSSAALRALRLGDAGEALVGLALLREGDAGGAAAALRGAAARPPPGLREDVITARLAEAELRSGRPAAAYRSCEVLRSRFADSPLRGETARFAYAAAQRWVAGAGADGEGEGPGTAGNEAATRALREASQWVLEDAPESEEAGEVRVRQALRRAARSSPRRALNILAAAPRAGAGGRAVALQEAFLRSARLQQALEGEFRLSGAVRARAAELATSLRGLPEGAGGERGTYAVPLAVARARAHLGSGRAEAALDLLRGLAPDLEVARTRIAALWLADRPGEAAEACRELLRSRLGSAAERFALALPVALAAVERPGTPLAAPTQRALFGALRAAAPATAGVELRAELALRQAEAASREGSSEGAVALVEEALVEGPEGPRSLATLALAAELFERGGRPERALETWQHRSELSEAGSRAWARSRVGVARSLAAVPGSRRDGCDVALSLLLSGRPFPEELAAELRALAGSCEEAGSLTTPPPAGTTRSAVPGGS